MVANRGHDWKPKRAEIQKCTKCGAEKWILKGGKPIYHTMKADVPGREKQPPCVPLPKRKSQR